MGTFLFSRARLSATALFLIVSLIASLFTLSSANAADSVAGEYIVQLKRSRTLLSRAELAATLDAEVVELLRKDMALIRKDLTRNTANVISDLNSHPAVEFAEPNYLYTISRAPDDKNYEKLWGLANAQAGIDINAEKAWDITTGSRKVIVAVIDTGVDFKHSDLKKNAWVNQREANGQPGVDDDNNGYIDDIHGFDFVKNSGDVGDDNGHGTHCAGTIGAEGNNKRGVAGVSWQVRIMGLKFLSKSGTGSLANAIKSIDYARKAGAHIMSNSWGGGSFSQALQKSIQDTNDEGILFVAAAGNSTQNTDKMPSYPGSYEIDNVVSVAAVDNSGKLGYFSNYGGRTVHVAAPGVDIFSTAPRGGYVKMSGTSMAAPHVSGIAALILANEYCAGSKCNAYSPKEIRARLIETSRPLSTLNGAVVANGIVDAHAALINLKHGPDESDPANWASRLETRISTPHPYANSSELVFEVDVPGAKQIALHFASFETEATYDQLKIFDASGNQLASLSGGLTGRYSPSFATDKLRLVFQPDGTLPSHGFDIDHIKFR